MKNTSTRKAKPSDPIIQYIFAAANAAEQYKTDVENGKITASKWIKLAVARSRKDETRTDIEFRAEAVARVYKFFYYLKISNGKKYTRFILTSYQAWILAEIFGWYYVTGSRRYRYALLYTARKSGKTVFSVGIELYVLIYDEQAKPEAYLCAITREQAGQALDYTKATVLESPAMKARLKVQQFQILYPKKHGKLKVLANKPLANDSLNPSVFIMDEMHAHKTLEFYNVMKSGILNRENPIGIITSTAGFNKDYPFFLMVETAKQVLEGTLDDDITFYALYTLDDEDDIEDINSWVKANPNIGVTIRLDALVKEWEKAKLTITEKNNFITKNLNRYLDNNEQWIPDDIYVTAFNEVKLPQPGTRPVAYMGIDLASIRDIAAIDIFWQDEETKRFGNISEFHFPQSEDKKVRNSGIDLGAWIEKDYIIEHPTATIDQKIILERIAYWHTIFEIRQINYDEWNSGFIIPEIESTLFINCVKFRQTATWFNIPLKYIEKIFFEKIIDMGTNPVMRWQFRNIVLYKDGNGNIKIMKNKSLDSVDGPVAFGMAVGGWLNNNHAATAEFFKSLMG
jgi:phage terminase large subunit-like protein